MVDDNAPGPPLRVRAIRGKGRGAIAARPLAKGEVLDRASVVIVPAREWKLISRSVLSAYCFTWEGGEEGDTAIALGKGSFCNHSYSPNAYARQNRRARVIEFVALHDIEEGEEVTINYNGDPAASDPMTFEVRE